MEQSAINSRSLPCMHCSDPRRDDPATGRDRRCEEESTIKYYHGAATRGLATGSRVDILSTESVSFNQARLRRRSQNEAGKIYHS